MNTIPFDIEIALRYPDRVVYRGGGKPSSWWYRTHLIKINKYCISSCDNNGLYTNDIHGNYLDGSKMHHKDLLLECGVVTKWYNVCTECASQYYNSEEEALKNKNKFKNIYGNYITTLSIDIPENLIS